MAANGDGPRNHPLLKDLNLPPLGIPNRPAPLLTKTLLVHRRRQRRDHGHAPGRLGVGHEVPRLRQGHRQGALGDRAAVRHDRRTDDVHVQGQAVHRRAGRRRRIIRPSWSHWRFPTRSLRRTERVSRTPGGFRRRRCTVHSVLLGRRWVKTPRRRVVALAALVSVTAGGGWYLLTGARTTTTPTGSRVGRLPRGVRSGDLNLLVITLDTTRADRLGAYGWSAERDACAGSDRRRRRAVRARRRARAAHAAGARVALHGKLPARHGVRDNGGFFLDERETTLAERLKARGLKTGGFVGAYVLDRTWGIAQGFDTLFRQLRSVEVRHAVARRGRAPGQRGRRSRAGVARDGQVVAVLRLGALLRRALAVQRRPSRIAHGSRIDPTSERSPSSIRRSPAIRAFLEAERLLDRTVVVVIGDHGESLGDARREHARLLHLRVGAARARS